MISQHHALICNLDGWHTATTCIVRVYIYRSFTGIWLVSARCQLGLHGYWKSADHLCGLETHSLIYIMVSQLFCYKKGCLSRFVAPDSSGYTVYPAVIRPHPTWFSGPLSYALRQTPCYTTHRLATVLRSPAWQTCGQTPEQPWQGRDSYADRCENIQSC